MSSITSPLDLIKLSLGEKVHIKLRASRTLTGTLLAYDPHLNIVLENAKEVVEKRVLDEETDEEVVERVERNIECVFVRGDTVVLVSPPIRTT